MVVCNFYSIWPQNGREERTGEEIAGETWEETFCITFDKIPSVRCPWKRLMTLQLANKCFCHRNIFSVYPTSKKSLIEKQKPGQRMFHLFQNLLLQRNSFSCRCVLKHELTVLICLLRMFIFLLVYPVLPVSVFPPSFSSCLLSTSFNPNYPHVFLLHLTAPAPLLMRLQWLLLPSWVPFVKAPNVTRRILFFGLLRLEWLTRFSFDWELRTSCWCKFCKKKKKRLKLSHSQTWFCIRILLKSFWQYSAANHGVCGHQGLVSGP